MIIGIPKETYPGERRVAMVPAAVPLLIRSGQDVWIEAGAGLAAGFTDEQFADKGATIQPDRAELFAQAGLIAQIRCAGANPQAGAADLDRLRPGQVVIGFCEPLAEAEHLRPVAEKSVTLLAMELIPRITRAQAMDALSSQASLAGYRGVILAAEALGKIFPMMMTAAGTIKAARVFVIGAGVAGLQAIATAKRLGALVKAIDVRPAVKEQVESLGAQFVMPEDVAEGEGGYARELTEDQKRRQQELMADVIAESDVVITTAAIPGRPAPKLIPADVVDRMHPGSVIVDLAAERGGNCELTQPGQTIEHRGVRILGPDNPSASVSHDASATYARNIVSLIDHLLDEQGQLKIDPTDEITAGAMVCHDGQITHPKVRQSLGLEPLEPTAPPDQPPAQSADVADPRPTPTPDTQRSDA